MAAAPGVQSGRFHCGERFQAHFRVVAMLPRLWEQVHGTTSLVAVGLRSERNAQIAVMAILAINVVSYSFHDWAMPLRC